jgi:riboflavin biosynthesis pyrimidine reductase
MLRPEYLTINARAVTEGGDNKIRGVAQNGRRTVDKLIVGLSPKVRGCSETKVANVGSNPTTPTNFKGEKIYEKHDR